MASTNKAAAAAGAAVAASSSLQTHTLHDLLFKLKEDVLRNRCVRESGDGDNDNDEGSNVDTTGGKRTSTAAASLSELLLRKSQGGAGHYLKRRRSDDKIPSAEADREASDATTIADGDDGDDDGDDDDNFRQQQKRRYRRLRDGCRADLEKSRSFHAESVRKIRELRQVYLHGLRTVSDLQNLREAPDAILPGNFPAAAFVAQGDATKKEPTTRPAPR
jgi:hypothetical protein